MSASQPWPRPAPPAQNPIRVVVVGSLNMDVVLGLNRMPEAGESVPAHDLQYLPGGKGANQALACARQGAEVALFGCVGRDHHGNALRMGLYSHGVDVDHVSVQEGVPTGTAVVMVEPDGSNRICVVAGANAALALHDDVLQAALAPAHCLLLQREVPDAVLHQALAQAAAARCPVVFNPSPAREVPALWWQQVHTVVLNAQEAGHYSRTQVADADSALRAAHLLLAQGPQQVVVTLGAQGAVAVWRAAESGGGLQQCVQPAIHVPVVDTTGAGDTFLGAMVVRWAEGAPLPEALAWASYAAGVCIGKVGAQAAIPNRAQVQQAMAAAAFTPCI